MSDYVSPAEQRRLDLVCPRSGSTATRASQLRAFTLNDVVNVVNRHPSQRIPQLVTITPLYRETGEEVFGAVGSHRTLRSVVSHGARKFSTTILVLIDNAFDEHQRLSPTSQTYCKALAATHPEDSPERAFWQLPDVTRTDFGGEKLGFLRNNEGELIPVTVLFKDTLRLVRQRKFYSHLLAYGHLKRLGCLEDGSLALLLDGDTTFTAAPVASLLAQLLADDGLAAVCARIKPFSENSVVVMAQEGSYAVDQFLNKAAERIIGGTVLCCPGAQCLRWGV